MHIIICDDERDDAEKVAEIMKKQLLAEKDELEIVSPDQLVLSLQSNNTQYDIIVLDIEYHREDLDGIKVGTLINQIQPNCQIIYLTGILDYASEVYETKHCYFVQKKNQNVTLRRAYEKARSIVEKNEEKRLLRLVVNGKEQFMQTGTIRYIQRDGRVLRIHGDKEYCCYETLSHIILELPSFFTRCHTGYIVNLNEVRTVSGDFLYMNDDKEIPIGRRYKKDFMDVFLKFLSGRA